MNPFVRGSAPTILLEIAPEATRRFVERRTADPGAKFAWPTRAGASILRLIRDALGQLTNEHCSYCDGYPVDAQGEVQVDHFQPKAQFPQLVCDWANLYFTCQGCNREKLDEWSPRLLRPDESGYSFERYFIVHVVNGELRANPAASLDDQARANETIRVLGLQRNGLCVARRRHIASSLSGRNDPDRPYRFL